MTVVKGNFGGGQGQGGGPPSMNNIDLTHAKTIECEKCKGVGFKQTMMLKKLSPLISPNGQEAIVPVGVFACESCGHVNKEFQEMEISQQG
tara:strand:+ start:350 stop:622 length:273 start_codon:yes stop_codon:yes gene_type:complete